jgi:hypothetical protein
MLSIPQLEHHQPLALLWLLQQLNILLAPQSLEADCRKYYWCGMSPGDTFSWSDLNPWQKRHLRFDPYDPTLHCNSKEMSDNSLLVRNTYLPGRFKELLGGREDVQFLNKLMEGEARSRSLYWLVERHTGGSTWPNWLVIYYLQCRACDLANFGQDIADLTFPEPTLKGATAGEVSDTVSWMAGLLQERMRKEEQQEDAQVRDKLEKAQQLRSAQRPPRVLVPKLPDHLSSRVLSGYEIEAVKKACLAGLSGSSVLNVITDVVQFCDLLARPENHVKVPSSQYSETQVNLYTTQEMTNQMAQELMNLPPRSAWAKVVSSAAGRESVWRGKIQTLAPAFPSDLVIDAGSLALTNALELGILKKRSVIDEEIRYRQEKWRRGPDKPEPTPPDIPPVTPRSEPPEAPPPPTHWTVEATENIPPPTKFFHSDIDETPRPQSPNLPDKKREERTRERSEVLQQRRATEENIDGEVSQERKIIDFAEYLRKRREEAKPLQNSQENPDGPIFNLTKPRPPDIPIAPNEPLDFSSGSVSVQDVSDRLEYLVSPCAFPQETNATPSAVSFPGTDVQESTGEKARQEELTRQEEIAALNFFFLT